jgi:hypothetical protein
VLVVAFSRVSSPSMPSGSDAERAVEDVGLDVLLQAHHVAGDLARAVLGSVQLEDHLVDGRLVGEHRGDLVDLLRVALGGRDALVDASADRSRQRIATVDAVEGAVVALQHRDVVQRGAEQREGLDDRQQAAVRRLLANGVSEGRVGDGERGGRAEDVRVVAAEEVLQQQRDGEGDEARHQHPLGRAQPSIQGDRVHFAVLSKRGHPERIEALRACRGRALMGGFD